MDSKPRRAPFKLYLVTMAMLASDGTGFKATRVVPAQDPDGACALALSNELRVQYGRMMAGGPIDTILGVVGLARMPGRTTN